MWDWSSRISDIIKQGMAGIIMPLKLTSLCLCPSCDIFIDREAREIMYLVASVRLSVWVYPGHIIHHYAGIWATCHYQSEEFVCVPNSRADAVDRLLITACDRYWDWCYETKKAPPPS